MYNRALTFANRICACQEAGRGGFALPGGCAKDQRAARCLAPRAQTRRQTTVIAVLNLDRASPRALCLNPLNHAPLSDDDWILLVNG
jgi:hypothetical protein